MRNNESIERKRRKIISYIRKNPTATYKQIKLAIKLHPNRYFNGLSDAYRLAGVKTPRLFERRTKEEKQRIIIDYIQKNPTCGQNEIIKNTGIKIQYTFQNIIEAYNAAGILYPKYDSYSRNVEEKRQEVLREIKKDPFITLEELSKKLKIKNFYRLFKDIDEIYKILKIEKKGKGEKIKERKRKDVVNFIKENTIATQREINRKCNTHIQELYKNGIFDAYKEAGVKFPFERLKLYGIGLEEIRVRAKNFEEEIAIRLTGYGTVTRLVKARRGFADIILERKDQKVVVKVKDYRKKDILITQIMQLNKYLEDVNVNIGLLICHQRPKKDKFIIGNNKIFIIEKRELNKIPGLIGGLSYNG